MKILLASSELHPYSKTGGLADMAGALARSLSAAGHRVGVVTPLYKGIQETHPALKKVDLPLDLPLGPDRVTADVWILEPEPNLTIYFIDQPAFYQRSALYQEGGKDYPDNAARFIFFSKAVTYLAKNLSWRPEVVHVHDWQAALVPLLLSHQKLVEGWDAMPRTCLTIHNLAYQGVFPAADYALANLPPDYFNLNGVEFYGKMNCLKAGIAYADVLTTVSPRYAREITTPESGCGLDGLLRKREGVLFGILNGVDYEEWNTTDNPYLECPYSIRNLTGKRRNKSALQAELGLPVAPECPLFGTISRLTEQKGLDIQIGALEEMLGANMQFVLLGNGSPAFEKAYRDLVRRHPAKAAAQIGFDTKLSHRIEAACDFYVMPSRFEPCGLNQMYSLRYGTIPIVRITGGLDDTVVDISEDQDRANGIKFAEYSARALAKSIRKALVLYGEPRLLRHYQENAMSADFSWDRAVERYVEVYDAGRPSSITIARKR